MIREFKASSSAPLTTRQTQAFLLLEQYGGAVRGLKGGENIPQGTLLPPIRVQVIRQTQFQPSQPLCLPEVLTTKDTMAQELSKFWRTVLFFGKGMEEDEKSAAIAALTEGLQGFFDQGGSPTPRGTRHSGKKTGTSDSVLD